jgi:hypothetical protein
MSKKLIVLVVIALILMTGISTAAEPNREKQGVTAAEKWVALVDNGKYADSWNEAADYFKGAIDRAKWEKMLQSVRKPLGVTVSRKIKTSVYRTNLPGAPDGEYVVVLFTTSFKNKKTAVETITSMLDKDGQWRVAGYYIK